MRIFIDGVCKSCGHRAFKEIEVEISEDQLQMLCPHCSGEAIVFELLRIHHPSEDLPGYEGQ